VGGLCNWSARWPLATNTNTVKWPVQTDYTELWSATVERAVAAGVTPPTTAGLAKLVIYPSHSAMVEIDIALSNAARYYVDLAAVGTNVETYLATAVTGVYPRSIPVYTFSSCWAQAGNTNTLGDDYFWPQREGLDARRRALNRMRWTVPVFTLAATGTYYDGVHLTGTASECTSWAGHPDVEPFWYSVASPTPGQPWGVSWHDYRWSAESSYYNLQVYQWEYSEGGYVQGADGCVRDGGSTASGVTYTTNSEPYVSVCEAFRAGSDISAAWYLIHGPQGTTDISGDWYLYMREPRGGLATGEVLIGYYDYGNPCGNLPSGRIGAGQTNTYTYYPIVSDDGSNALALYASGTHSFGGTLTQAMPLAWYDLSGYGANASGSGSGGAPCNEYDSWNIDNPIEDEGVCVGGEWSEGYDSIDYDISGVSEAYKHYYQGSRRLFGVAWIQWDFEYTD
jgi:hypothetical protein